MRIAIGTTKKAMVAAVKGFAAKIIKETTSMTKYDDYKKMPPIWWVPRSHNMCPLTTIF